MAPELSVIITTHDRRELLRSCLDSLGRQTAPADAFEVVVVVDGSTDGTAEMLDGLAPPYRLSVITQQQAGPSTARNAGAARAEGQILLFIDDDEEAGRELVAAHLRAHRVEQKIAGVGVIDHRVPADADRFALSRVDVARAHNAQLASTQLTYVDCYAGNCSVTRAAFEQVGGFATDLVRENDFEFAYRLDQVGVQFRLLPDAVVTEYRTRGWREIVADMELRGRLAVELYRRHPPMIEKMEFGGYGVWSWRLIVLRNLALALRVRPGALARLGFVLPRDKWRRDWFRLAWNHSYWYGVKAESDHDLWRRSRRGTLILRYHAFGEDDEQASRYVVPRRRFARQMALLKHGGYNVISLSEYVEYRREHRFPPPRSVVITIDDGYVDNDTVARPILERLGLTAIVFLITGHQGRNPGATDPVLAPRPVFDLTRARDMLGAIQFGAHTRTHPDLTTLEPAAIREQALGSKEDLEQVLGVPVTNFAYPFGEVSPGARDAVERCGFWSACGVTPGHNRPATDSFDLRRIEVRGTYSLLRFAATLLLGDTSRLGLRPGNR